MLAQLISADNHIDLTYCPPELWSDRAPAAWKEKVPRVVEQDDGLHWMVDGIERGTGTGVSKKHAEQAAARVAAEWLRTRAVDASDPGAGTP